MHFYGRLNYERTAFRLSAGSVALFRHRMILLPLREQFLRLWAVILDVFSGAKLLQ